MSIAFTVPEIFTNLLAEYTWRKSSSSKTIGSIRKLKMLLLVKKNYIFQHVKVSK
jgi:hypothetical protein